MKNDNTGTSRTYIVNQLRKLSTSAQDALANTAKVSAEQKHSRCGLIASSTVAAVDSWTRDKHWRETLCAVRQAKGPEYARDIDDRLHAVGDDVATFFHKGQAATSCISSLHYITLGLRMIAAELPVLADEIDWAMQGEEHREHHIDDELIDLDTASAILDVSKRTLHNWRSVNPPRLTTYGTAKAIRLSRAEVLSLKPSE